MWLLIPSLCFAQFFSQVVGIIEDEAITSREVELQFLVDRILFDRRPIENMRSLNIPKKRFSQEVTSTLIEMAVEKEARVFAVATVSDKKIEQLAQEFWAKVGSNQRWQYLDFQVTEAKVVIERKLRTRQFLDFKKDSTIVPITDREARDYFESNRVRFGSLPFERFSENIKRFLSTQKLNQRLQEWFELLRKKYRIRNIVAEKG